MTQALCVEGELGHAMWNTKGETSLPAVASDRSRVRHIKLSNSFPGFTGEAEPLSSSCRVPWARDLCFQFGCSCKTYGKNYTFGKLFSIQTEVGLKDHWVYRSNTPMPLSASKPSTTSVLCSLQSFGIWGHSTAEMQWKHQGKANIPRLSPYHNSIYMFFLLQITAGKGFVQQRLVSSNIENILEADPSFCPRKTWMVRKQSCYLRITRSQASPIKLWLSQAASCKTGKFHTSMSSWRNHLSLILNSHQTLEPKDVSWTVLRSPG